ncbi:MAG: 3-isopropylmalate dehydratase small subunit [Gammaproteobacteria bacterium]|nr:3-isopropylmalate dehydratase small subunit [Gammaproteobacteria bacterium]NNM12883.1 3-isopropylmalate dehydratase small subunit [Gammaproteobacteria bacterium]
MSQNSQSNMLVSKTFNLLTDNIDTDQIIPAKFLTTTSRKGLGAGAFYNWRYDESGNELSEHAFTQFDPQDTAILVGGNNFGCGSSREHAPWALLDLGFKVVMSTQFADIFRNNCIKNGLLPIVIDAKTYQFLSDNPVTEVTINISALSYDINGFGSFTFELDEFSQYCLSHNYDQLDYLLSQQEKIDAYEKALHE